MNKPELPLCYKCGKVMKLVSLRRWATEHGKHYPWPDDSYTIECCDRQLLISDNEERREVIRLLKEYHKTE